MAKVASSSTTKRASTPKSGAAAAKVRNRPAKEGTELALVSNSASPAHSTYEPAPDSLHVLTARLNALEENLTARVSALATAVQALPQSAGGPSAEQPLSETVLPVLADVIRRSLMEHLTPLVASLKRIEERVGFIGNRLKHPGPSQEQRQKPWRHDQQQRHGRQRGPNGGPRQNQGQTWTPPSAASVQGHFAPRPLRGGETTHVPDDDE